METLTERVRALIADRNRLPRVVGVRTGGVWVARALMEALGWDGPVGELDIAFYRDDFSRHGLNPTVRPSSLPFSLDDEDILLVDDVIMSGRTLRAAMNELFDYGRPARIQLATLVDLGRRELPIQPDAVGVTLRLAENERVKLTGPEPLDLELRYIAS
ncbi:MAG: bifunctional pyr operon transcriptional regulator/uracil phosphoribosyltransferase PyrR [Gammaproteobacteria bacterium]|nr:MAG: bifunctional pyr operon transcriptional regulator/uracil phosphoribosyltransferase PyrR [Gammaproteobacteria bacterium]